MNIDGNSIVYIESALIEITNEEKKSIKTQILLKLIIHDS